MDFRQLRQLAAYSGSVDKHYSTVDSQILGEAESVVRQSLATGCAHVGITVTVPKDTAAKFLSLIILEQRCGAMVIPDQEEYSPAAAGQVLGVSRQTVISDIQKGRLPGHKAGTHWRVSATDVHDFLVKQGHAAAKTRAVACPANMCGD